MEEQRGPDPVELVRHISLSEWQQPTNIVHAAHLKQQQPVKYFSLDGKIFLS